MLSISVLAPVPYFLPAYFQSLVLRVHGDDLFGCYPKTCRIALTFGHFASDPPSYSYFLRILNVYVLRYLRKWRSPLQGIEAHFEWAGDNSQSVLTSFERV